MRIRGLDYRTAVESFIVGFELERAGAEIPPHVSWCC
jgi:hypothetical protein